jgi:hypothetical protein
MSQSTNHFIVSDNWLDLFSNTSGQKNVNKCYKYRKSSAAPRRESSRKVVRHRSRDLKCFKTRIGKYVKTKSKQIGIMATKLCYNRGCGKQYNTRENSENCCLFHPGAPFFHDAFKGKFFKKKFF